MNLSNTVFDSSSRWPPLIATWWSTLSVEDRPKIVFHEMLSDVLDVKVWTLSNLTRLGNALCKMGFRRTRTGAYVRKVGYIPPVVVHCVESFSAVAADALTSEELKRVDGLREALGVPGAAKRLGVSPTSLLRVLASAPVHRGTVLLLRQALIALGEPGTSEDKL